MSDLFISYKREDFARVARLVDALAAEGFDVWWDQKIPPGAPWEAAITEALDKARCVIVCWSAASTHPQTGAKVQVEARVANDSGKLLQVKLDEIAQPLFFRQWQAADLSGWTGDRSNDRFRMIARAAREIIEGSGSQSFPSAPAQAKRPQRRRRLRLYAAAAVALLLIGGGAAAILSPDARLAVCTLSNPDKLCLSQGELDGFEARLADAKARLAQRAVFYINDRRQNFPSIAWAITQLAAPNAEGLSAHKADFNRRMADLINPECGCLVYGPAPHTMSNAWMLVAAAAFNDRAPATIIDAILAGQSAEGWWSSTLDAVDEPDNGATYATAFVILALEKQLALDGEDPARAEAMRRAIDAASLWLVHQASTASGFMSDYPQSLRKLTNPGIDGQTLAALAVSKPEIDLGGRAKKLSTSLAKLPPLWTTASSDVLVMRRNNAQYYDDFRHISAAWTVLGSASALPDLGALERARVLAAVRRAFARDLASTELFEREWVAAEAIFALGETVKRLKAMEEKGLDKPFGGAGS